MTANRQKAGEIIDLLYDLRDETGDITFIVGTERIKAHRCVLDALSPERSDEFFDDDPDHDEIYVPSVSADHFKVFLDFFYKDTVNLTVENIDAVFDLVGKSNNEEFYRTCFDFLFSKLTPQNICWAYGIGVKHGNDWFRYFWQEEVRSDPKAVFASDGFLHCGREVLLQILYTNSLGCSEMDVFKACIAWARAHCEQNNMDDRDPKNLRAALGDAIYRIRFASMDPKEFAALHKSLPGFFTNDEAIELFYIVNKLDGFRSRKFTQELRSDPEVIAELFHVDYED